MNAGQVAVGVVFLLIGLGLVVFGIGLYTNCESLRSAAGMGSPGGAMYPSGCGATLFVAGFGGIFALLGGVSVVRGVRTTSYRLPVNAMPVPPPVFSVSGRPLPSIPTLPKLQCPYCRGMVDPVGGHCPNCGAPL